MAKINVASKDYVNEKISEIVNFTGASDTENGKSGLVPAPNSGTDNRYLRSDGLWSEIDPASGDSNGLLESTDKVKLDGIEAGANKTIVDSELSDTSKNPVENNVINNALEDKANKSHTHTKAEITDFPTALPADGGNSTTVNNHTVNSDVPENAVFTDTVYDDTEIKSDISNKVDKAEGFSLISSTDLAQISTNKDDILALKGDGTGSIDTMIDEKINAWATQLTNDGTVNTYAEAIQWIADHGSEYTTLLGEVSNKVDKISGKGLSTNDLTTALKSNYDTAYTHSQSDHARTDATKVEASTTNGNIKINGSETTVYTHPSGTNPHGTTKSDVGLGNVPNVTTNDQTPSYTESSSLTKLTSGEKLSVAFGKISKAITDLISHIGDSVKHITSTERTNWNAAKTHADSAHAPSNAQANVIETVKVNGTALTPSSKAVDITVPTVGNGTITVTQNGSTKGTFTTNQSGNTTIALDDNNTVYTHPTSDGNKHVPANGTSNGGKYLKATATAGSYEWGSLTKSDVTTALGYAPPTTNTTYGVATSSTLGLVKSGTDITVDSSGNVSVNDDSHNHVISNVDGLQSALDGKSVSKTLTNENLNNVTTPGFYNAGGGNTVANKPSGIEHFGLIVIHRASGAYYTQIIFNDASSYRRFCVNGTWGSWAQDKLTDTDTWRGIQNNLTSDSTTDSLSAAQGKVLKKLIDSKTESLTGATADNDGSAGLVPAPSAGDQNKFLRGDGTWQEASGGSSEDCLPKTGGIVTGNVQQSGPTTDYTTYKFRNIAFGTSSTPTADAEYGGNGSIYFNYS